MTVRAMFRSLAVRNYRLWFIGAIISNVGTWMQRTAQDWIVISDLTHHDAAAVGVTLALQFGPSLLLVPVSGYLADRVDNRRLLIATQSAMALTGLGLGVAVLAGVVNLWVLWGFALLTGIVAAVDAPARQTMAAALVGTGDVANAVALNAASFNAARLVGPAVAGLLIGVVGAGWVFVINGLSFVTVIGALALIRDRELAHPARVTRSRGALFAGFRYVRSRLDLAVVLALVFVAGAFALNMPVFLATMAAVEFDVDASGFGALSSALAIGSVVGALASAKRDRPRLRIVVAAVAGIAVTLALAAGAPTVWLFVGVLPLIGVSIQSMTTSANGYVQLATEESMRGRVMALYMAVLAGGTPIGAPIMGWLSNTLSPRWAMLIAAAVTAVAAAVAWFVLHRSAGSSDASGDDDDAQRSSSPAMPRSIAAAAGAGTTISPSNSRVT